MSADATDLAAAADRVEGDWAAVLGQPAAVNALQAALGRDELAHAWLVVGPPQVGQQELVRALGGALNCPESPTPQAGCARCDACRRMREGKHPALLELEPKGASYLVDDVRGEWIPAAMHSLTEGRRKVLRVRGADRMNEAAQNAFLKVLEEPPASVLWVLEVEDEGALLDTVVSRCRRLDLVPWGLEPLRTRAAELAIPVARREALARAALGSPARLEALAEEDVAAARDRHLGIIDQLASAGPGAVVPLAKALHAWAKSRSAAVKASNDAEFARLESEFGVDERGRGWPPGMRNQVKRTHERTERQAQRAALDLLLDDLASYLRDLVTVASGGGSGQLVNLDAEVALRRDAERLPVPDAVRALSAVAHCRTALDRNGNPDLQLERLLLQLALPLYAASA